MSRLFSEQRKPSNMRARHFIKAVIFLSLAGLVPALSASAQSFVNLNFESANLPPVQGLQGFPNNVPIGLALPGWTAYLGGTQQTVVGQNTEDLDGPTVDILGPNWGTQPGPSGGSLGIIDGNYSVLLQSGVYITDQTASIAQTGTVPTYAQSLTFKAWELYSWSTFSVSFAGNNLTPILLSTGTSALGQPYDVYVVDISAYAGHTGQLEFTQNYVYNEPVFSALLLDDVAFSPLAAPEPGPVVLFGVAGLLVISRRRRI